MSSQPNTILRFAQTLPQEARRLAGLRQAIAAEVKRLGWREEVRAAWDETEKALQQLVSINEQAVKMVMELRRRGIAVTTSMVQVAMPTWTERHYDSVNGLGSFIEEALVVVGLTLSAVAFVASLPIVATLTFITTAIYAGILLYTRYMASAQEKALALAKLGRDPKDLPGNNRNSGTGIGEAITNIGVLGVIGLGLLLALNFTGRK